MTTAPAFEAPTASRPGAPATINVPDIPGRTKSAPTVAPRRSPGLGFRPSVGNHTAADGSRPRPKSGTMTTEPLPLCAPGIPMTRSRQASPEVMGMLDTDDPNQPFACSGIPSIELVRRATLGFHSSFRYRSSTTPACEIRPTFRRGLPIAAAASVFQFAHAGPTTELDRPTASPAPPGRDMRANVITSAAALASRPVTFALPPSIALPCPALTLGARWCV